MAAVSPADLHDSNGGVALLRASRQLWPFLAHCFADRAYRCERVGTATSISVEIVEAEVGQTGLAMQQRRWMDRAHPGLDRSLPQAGPRSRGHRLLHARLLMLAAAMILVRRLARPL